MAKLGDPPSTEPMINRCGSLSPHLGHGAAGDHGGAMWCMCLCGVVRSVGGTLQDSLGEGRDTLSMSGVTTEHCSRRNDVIALVIEPLIVVALLC